MLGSAPHILIVDDDPSVIEALAAALKGAYVIHGAATGEAACAILRGHPVSGIILDAMLGGEHGLDLIERFRALSRAPVVLLTGYGSEELAVRALRARVSDYLRKPVNLKELRGALGRAIHQHGGPPDPVERTRLYLFEHLERPHRTTSLARMFGLSERHLSRQFREVHGTTPRRYLTAVRMQRAADLLRATRLGVEQIAQAVGYPSVVSFNRIFKGAFGLSPSDWRARYGPPESQDPDVHDSQVVGYEEGR